MSETVAFDDSQLAVIDADVGARLVITAAAGQGKTEVVVARLRSLNEQGLDVTEEVLVLSFSRAAVDAVRRRTGQAGLDHVEVRTFDSFAGKILFEAGELDSVQGGFEARIRRATELIESGEADVDHYVHVILDESQDLVGDRAELVVALLTVLEKYAGFTVLGDPLQGIYDFQLDENSSYSKLASQQLLNRLVSQFGAEPCALTGHYRALSERARQVIAVGDNIRDLIGNDAEPEPAHALLDEYRSNGGPDGSYRVRSLSEVTGYLEDLESDETAAVLTTTNYEALCISETLGDMGIGHVVRRRARDAGIDRWVASLLASFELRKYTRSEFDEAVAACPHDTPSGPWNLLKEVENDIRDHRTLNIHSLNRRMRNTGVPLSLTPSDKADVVVSTIHRAKGLEFDYVIDVEPPQGSPGSARDYSNLRRRYVASTRSREELFILDGAPRPGAYSKNVDGRWVEYRFGKGANRYPARIEVTNDDIETAAPCIPNVGEPFKGQDSLADHDLWGENVDLVLLSNPEDGNEVCYWVRSEKGVILGRTSQKFGRDLRRHLIRRRHGDSSLIWPKQLVGARIASVETVAGDPELTRSAGMGASGFWLVPRLSGLVHCLKTTEEGKSTR